MKNHGGTRLAFIHDMNRHYWSIPEVVSNEKPEMNSLIHGDAATPESQLCEF
jgi:hypothetical protein